MRSRLIPLAAAVLALATVPAAAHANNNTLTSKGLVSGAATVTACGALSSIVPNYTISSGTVTAVVLSNIPTTCNNAKVNLNITNAIGTSLAAGGPVVITSTTATVPISPAVATASVVTVRLAVTGP